MKLAIAALGTSLVLANGASAMVGPYERAVNETANAAYLVTTGESAYEQVGDLSNSPQADWNNGDAKEVTVFPSNASTDAPVNVGVNAR